MLACGPTAGGRGQGGENALPLSPPYMDVYASAKIRKCAARVGVPFPLLDISFSLNTTRI